MQKVPRTDASSDGEILGDTAPLPTDLAPDFAPLSQPQAGETNRDQDSDRYSRDSLQAHAEYEQGVKSAASGDENKAVQHLLQASKLAEDAREWYLTAVCCERVGDFLQHPNTPFELTRALRTYRRAVAAYEQCGHVSEACALSYRLCA